MSNQTKHTPGPWCTEHTTSVGHDLWYLFHGPGRLDVFGHFSNYGERHVPHIRPNLTAEANARLIAAAPELLAALHLVTHQFANVVASGLVPVDAMANVAIEKARAAISSAEGRAK